MEYHVLIEYSHRLTAFLDIVAIAALAVYAWRGFRRERRVAVPAVAAFGLVIVQALLGAIVVWSKLEALNVTLHLATAMLLVASVVLATVGAFTIDVVSTGRDRLRTQAWWTAGAVYALLVVGALVRGEGAGLAFRDWPLMDGRLVPSLGRVGPAVQFVHRGLALVAGVLVVWLAVRARGRRAERPATARWASVAAVLFAAQVLLGAANVWTGLATWAVVGHVLLASLVWGALVATASLAGVEAARSSAPGASDARGRRWPGLGGRGPRAHRTRRPSGLGHGVEGSGVSAPARALDHEGRARRPGLGGAVAAYVALTKPRIIELLLVTTVPTMVAGRGRAPVPVADGRPRARRHARRGRRQRHQHVRRPRHRRRDAPHPAAARSRPTRSMPPRAALTFADRARGRRRSSGSGCSSTCSRAVLAAARPACSTCSSTRSG